MFVGLAALSKVPGDARGFTSAQTARAALPPYLITPLPSCSIILDRHTHKNGGSTQRQIFNSNDMRDGWTFWGYGLHQHAMITSNLVGALFGPKNESCSDWSRRPSLRFVAEHHYSRVALVSMLGYFGPISPLQQVAARCRCRVVLVTRLREPLSFYISFYRWTVSWRQIRNATAFGRTMVEWAPRNLQSSMVMAPLDATWAEFIGVHTEDGRSRRRVYSQFDPPGHHPAGTQDTAPGQGARRTEELRRALAAFDLVGLVERFDETLLMLADLTGLQRILYTRLVPSTTNHHYPQPSVAAVCPDRAACAARIREVAPTDHLIYDEARQAFEKRLAALGPPFLARLAAFRAANRQHQKRMKAKEDAVQAAETVKTAYYTEAHARRALADDDRVYARHASAPTEMHVRVPMGRLVCALGHSPIAVETCQRVYADTPFRYNWRHTRASCCRRITACLAYRMARRRVPPNCFRWLPPIADPDDNLKVRGKGFEAMARAVNASWPTMCSVQCSAPPDPEPQYMLPGAYRVPSKAERRATLQLLRPAASDERYQRRFTFSRIGCNDTPAEALDAGKPWLDFEGCAAEGDTHENLNSPQGQCARDTWMRVNCKRTCGLCGLSLREAIELRPRAALTAARSAARLRGTLKGHKGRHG